MEISKLQGFADGTGFIRMTRCLGKSLLKRNGFLECNNPAYLRKVNIYAHHNKIMGVWIIENATKTGNGLAI